MAYYEVFSFSEQEFHEQMLAICDMALDEAVNTILANEYFKGGLVVSMPMENYTSFREITATDLKAWIVEYGMGDAADTERNPYWDEYVNSGYTSSLRTSGTVVNRGSRFVKSIDFENNKVTPFYRGSSPEGRVAPDNIQDKARFEPQPFLQDLLHEAFIAFNNSFNAKTSNFDVTTCFVKSQINI